MPLMPKGRPRRRKERIETLHAIWLISVMESEACYAQPLCKTCCEFVAANSAVVFHKSLTVIRPRDVASLSHFLGHIKEEDPQYFKYVRKRSCGLTKLSSL